MYKNNDFIFKNEYAYKCCEIESDILTGVDYSHIIDGCLIVPDGVKSIKDDLFYYCDKLKEIVLPCSLKKIGNDCFKSCHNLEKVIFEYRVISELKEIGEGAFANCTKLSEIRLPDSVKTIQAEAFKDSGIEKIFIPENVEFISDAPFMGCEKLNKIVIDKNNERYSDMNCNVIYDNYTDTIIQGCKRSRIPIETDTIGTHSFYNLNLDRNIINANNITCIQDGAFERSNIKKINLKNVDTIGELAFSRCHLEELIINGNKDVRKNTFYMSEIDELKFNNIDLSNFNLKSILNAEVDKFIFKNTKSLQGVNKHNLDILDKIIEAIPYAEIIIEDIEKYPQFYEKYEDILTPTIEYYLDTKKFSEINKTANKNEKIVVHEDLER